MIDYLTKWPIAVALPDKKAETVARAFVEELICVHGAPESILSDQGREFLNEVLTSINSDLHVHRLKTSAYHPQTDGLTERFNSTLQNMLSMYVADHQRDWDIYIPYVLAAYRCSVNEATLETPFYLMYGRDHYMPIDVSLGLPRARADDGGEDYRSGLVERLMIAFKTARENQVLAQEKNCRSYNRTRTDRPFELGEKVWLHVPHVRPQRSKKFTRPWRGPYRIVEARGGLNYGLVGVHNPRDHQFAHVSRLKRWIGSEDTDDHGVPDTGVAGSTASPNEHVEVEEILNDRTTASGLEYLIRFKGHTDRHNQWVPVNEVRAPGAISHYERGRKLTRRPPTTSTGRSKPKGEGPV
jgi:hypothetical protein